MALPTQPVENQILVYDPATGNIQKVSAEDNLKIGGDFESGGLLKSQTLNVTSDASIGGNLFVQGDVVAGATKSVLFGDNFIDLLSGNLDTVAVKSGGFTVSTQAVGNAYDVTDFTVGLAPNNPTFTTSTPPTDFAVGLIVQISGSTDGKNDGQYEIIDITGSVVTVAGVGGTSPNLQVPFCHTQFEAMTGLTGCKVTAVALSALATGDTSLYETIGTNSPTAVGTGVPCWVYANPATVANIENKWQSLDRTLTTLQMAYDANPGGAPAGNIINLTEGRNFEIQTPFGVTAGFSLNGRAPSVLQTSMALTIAGSIVDITDGNVRLYKAGVTGIMGDSDGLAVGTVVYTDTAGDAVASVNNDPTEVAREVDGVVVADDIYTLATVAGTVVEVLFKSGETLTLGAKAYLSDEAGKATMTVPTTGRVFELGKVVNVNPVNTDLYRVRWNPQYIADI